MLGGTFLFGRMVGRRAVSASAATAGAAALATTDVAGLTARLVTDERARLGGQALGIIRASVEVMRNDADTVVTSLDPSVIQGIADGGGKPSGSCVGYWVCFGAAPPLMYRQHAPPGESGHGTSGSSASCWR